MSETVRVACVQLNSSDNMQANIATIRTLVSEAAGQWAKLITLPENAFLMEIPSAGGRVLYTEEEHPGVHAASALARENGIWLLVGSVAIKIDDSGKTVNRSLLFDEQGYIAAHYDKIHLFDAALPSGETYAESARFLPGSEARIAVSPWAKIGMSVCYDVRFPQLYRYMAQGGAEILTVPSAFTATTGEAHWHTLLCARAIENGCFVIAPAQTGTHPGGRATYGHSLIIDPWGTVLADAGKDVGIITADLDISAVATIRSRLPSLRHGRDFTLTTV